LEKLKNIKKELAEAKNFIKKILIEPEAPRNL
jgi:hypothetical protein